MRPLKLCNNNGSIQLKFSVDGKRYSFNPVRGGSFGNPHDMAKAQAIATQIQLDILAGHFDSSLTRYKPASPESISQDSPSTPQDSLLTLWDDWVEYLCLPAHTKANHYHQVRQMLVKANPALVDTLWFTQSTLAPATFNKRLGMLRSCMEWAIK
ncbi:MAG: DUF3596 domain-containing protein [Leptolyngbyaceae cyanobacterium bins.349]|nr:DUF3596 domain-containing protein [Leptolyngbyaceae cyanobacterium bins.349]